MAFALPDRAVKTSKWQQPEETIDMNKTESEALREDVARACRVIGRLGLIKAATGHLSARIPGTDRVFIRARGPKETGVRYTTVDDVILIDLDGKKIDGRDGLKPPMETVLHTSIYKARPEVNGIVHAHPPSVVLFTICNKPLLPIFGGFDPSGTRLLLEGIPMFPHSQTVTTREMGEKLAAMMTGRACLMRGHGMTTAGSDVVDASLTAITLNTLAEMNYKAYLLGDPQTIPEDEMEPYRKKGKKNRKNADALWEYYCKLVDA